MGDLLDLAQRVCGWANADEQVEVYARRGESTSVKAYKGEVESLTSAQSSGIGVRVVVGGRQGFASAGTLDESVVKETLQEARDNSAYGAFDECNGLQEPDGVAAVDLDLWRDELASFPPDRKVEMAIELEKAVMAADPRIRGIRTASFADSTGEVAVATTTGIAVERRGTSCYLTVSALAEENGDTQTGFGVSIGRAPSDLDIQEAASQAGERATRLLGATKPRSAKVTVILDPYVTSSFLSIIGGTLNGESVLKGRSPFGERLGESIAAPVLSLMDDPLDPEALGATEYDSEGLAARRIPLIQGGVLQGFMYNTYAGRRAGKPSTASAVRGYGSTPGVGAHALTVVPGDRTQEQLIADIGDGVLVQSVSGLHSGVNPVSGDFSVGADGLVVRGGSVAEPFREATIASTLQRMLTDVVAVGADLQWLPMGAAGVSLVIRDVALGGS